MASTFLTQLNLSADERHNPPPLINRLKTIMEWASAALDAVKNNPDFLAALKSVSPFAEALKDSIAPVKFFVKLLDELTKIQDPEPLARVACTLAYQSAAEKAIKTAAEPAHAAIPGAKLDDAVDDVDFSNFTTTQAVTHPFVAQSDRILQNFLPRGGFSEVQVNRIIADIHLQFPAELDNLLSNAQSKEKFDPLFRWLQLPPEGRLSRAALRRHADYQAWLFNKAPVFQREPYALAHICLEAESSKLTYRDLRADPMQGRAKPNPFAEGDANGGRHSLLETVMDYISDPKFREPIILQGSAGCGKSTFTLRLADHLQREGLRPLRIRLRDIIIGEEFYSQLGKALTYQDDFYIATRERFVPPDDPLRNGAIFHEELRYGPNSANVCPYVLILDGWDEISVAVSEGYRQRVKELLLRIRAELLRPGMPIVRVILTGRPSDAIDECTEFFRDETPVLTVRTLNPSQLPAYAEKLRKATERGSSWTVPSEATLAPIYERYQDPKQTEVSAVLGYPLLLHVTFRLLAEPNIDPHELIESPANLLRRLTDFATSTADKATDEPGAKIMRLSGSDLRSLLRRTAAAMTTLGQESISKFELEKRLKTTDVVRHVQEIAKDNLISALLVAFYFKGGNTALGCEFTHKAFREYLFAEEIVETLKAYARKFQDDLPERPASLYWKDFEEADPRRKATRDFANLLAPQWLSREVVRYLGSLLEWEVNRTYAQPSLGAGETIPLTHEEWQRALTLLADLWDWWAEGVHLRPQPKEDQYGHTDLCRSYADELVRFCRPIAPDASQILEPIRTTTLDAHLGDALFRLCAWVHWYMAEHPGRAAQRSRRYQGLNRQRLAFRPTGPFIDYFGFFCSRIGAAGWRPIGRFPTRVFGKGLDLSGTDLPGLTFYEADLETSSLRRAGLFRSDFYGARMIDCDFTGSTIKDSSFLYAELKSANFSGARIATSRFVGASLHGASFANVKTADNSVYPRNPRAMAPLPSNDFTGAQGIDPAITALLTQKSQ